jgi:hypothetical protein
MRTLDIKKVEDKLGKHRKVSRSTTAGKHFPKFQDLLDDYMDGLTAKQIAEKYGLKVDTVKPKIADLAIEAKRLEERIRKKVEGEVRQKFEQDKGTPSLTMPINATPSTSGEPSQTPPPSGAPNQPPATVNAPSVTLPSIKSTPSVNRTESQEDEEEVGEVSPSSRRKAGAPPNWLSRGDGGTLVNTIEMAIRGVNTKETFSPITILLLSYLKFLGGPEMADMTFGEMVDWSVRRLCKEKGIDIQIGRNFLTEDVKL